MPLIDQSAAAEIIASHVQGLFEIPTSAWDDYHRKLPADVLVRFCPRTRASGVHDLMVANASIYASKADGVRFFDSKMMKGIAIGPLAIRMKKLDDEGSSRSQPTKQVLEFRRQKPLDGIEAIHNLELGYVLNDAETDIVEVMLVCPSGDGVYWSLLLGQGGAEPGIVDLFRPPQDPKPIPPSKIKPKSGGTVIPIRKQSDDAN